MTYVYVININITYVFICTYVYVLNVLHTDHTYSCEHRKGGETLSFMIICIYYDMNMYIHIIAYTIFYI